MECLEKADFALECNSNEMLPYIMAGDLVLVRKQSAIESGKLVVLHVDGKNLVRRYCPCKNGNIIYRCEDERYTLHSTDTENSEIQIMGLVVGVVRAL